jgi:serine/threonine-protein kinase
MEYVRGTDVSSLIDRDGAMPFQRAAPLLGQVLSALGEAHELGVVHRDLKPENILVTRTHGGQDFVKVLDFGLAKLSEREDLAEVTGRGSIVGTPYYMSPEQIRGDEVDHRADIYSMGALMYRVLTSEHAFTAKTPVGVLTKHLTEAVVPPTRRCPELELDSRIDDMVVRCLQKNPMDRYQTVHELLDDVEQLFSEIAQDTTSALRRIPPRGVATFESSEVRRRGLADPVDYGIEEELRLRRSDLDRFERALKRKRTIRVLGFPTLAILGGVGLLYYWLMRPEQPHLREEEPNDYLETANLIAARQSVTGWIGKRISKTEADRDFFRLQATPSPSGQDTLSVELSGIPNMDLELYVYDSAGTTVAHVDEGGLGQGETLRRFRVTRPVILMVGQVRPPGSLPVENVSDAYTLTARLDPVDQRLETEPNDTPADATPVRPSIGLSGYLDRRTDVDLLRFEGARGRYRITISGAASVPLRWGVNGGLLQKDRQAEIELSPGDLIRLERADRGLAAGLPLPGADEAYTVTLEAKAER